MIRSIIIVDYNRIRNVLEFAVTLRMQIITDTFTDAYVIKFIVTSFCWGRYITYNLLPVNIMKNWVLSKHGTQNVEYPQIVTNCSIKTLKLTIKK